MASRRAAPDRDPIASAVALARKALDRAASGPASDALPHLREAFDHVSEAIDEAMAAAVLEEGVTLRGVGALAGLSENTVGPRLARTTTLHGYQKDGRITAGSVERARYDRELGRPAPRPEPEAPDGPPEKLRFQPRRPSTPRRK